ncbi:ATP-dependent helicase [Thauera humireducens]|uniref:ATP-dependent helicase n=1 Tax=Thauera humireducens TaxID=1134435 RepID=UPI00311F7814
MLDYDDLLLYWAQMVAEPALGEEIGGLFDHVLVDEYQDTNLLQASILLAMKPDGRGLTVVGDDAQSIYAFRGATVRNILDFPAAFEPPAQVVTLEQNYRSTRPILAAANVIALARRALHQEPWSECASRPSVRAWCRSRTTPTRPPSSSTPCWRGARRGSGLKQQAVLFRASAHSAPRDGAHPAQHLLQVKFGGLKFLEAAHVKDVLAVLRWAENPRTASRVFRAIQLLAGVGPKTGAGRVLDNVCAAPEGCALLAEQPVPDAARAGWQEFAALVERLAERPQWPADFELACRWYEAQMPRLYDDFAVRVLDVQQLARIAATSPSRQRFLTELTLDPPSATSGEAGMPLLDEDYLILSTMHSAKGQEWNAVSVLNVVDGCIPSDVATRNSAEVEEGAACCTWR